MCAGTLADSLDEHVPMVRGTCLSGAYVHVDVHFYAHVYAHVYTLVYAHVYAHVYTHVHRHAYGHPKDMCHAPSGRARRDRQKEYRRACA